MKTLVTIIVPTKNEALNLSVLFESLINQTFKNFDVIVNDDSFTNDTTTEVIKKYSKRIRITYINKNIKMAQARSEGAKMAKGKYLYHVDADMKLSPKVLEECVSKMDDGYDALIIPEISYGSGFWSKVKIFERTFYQGDEMMESARFYKKSVYWKIGGHDVKLVASEDKDIHLRVKGAGYKIGRVKFPIYHNEGHLTLTRTMKKKFYYGTTVNAFIKKHKGHAAKQANTVFRPAFIKNYRVLFKKPILTIGLAIMKFVELIAAGLGYLLSKVGILK